MRSAYSIKSVEERIVATGIKDRLEAALWVRSDMPSWYWQTPEGEYLEYVIRTERAAKQERLK